MLIDNFIKWSQGFRAKIFASLFALLTKLSIKPNHITFFRFLLIPLFLHYLTVNPQLGVGLIILASALDWFDGGLARYQKSGSDRGKFWDVLVDHLIYVAALFGLILIGEFSVIHISYQLMIAPVLYLLAIIAASEKAKTDWIINPYYRIIYFKPVGLLAVILWAFTPIDVIDPAIAILNLVMTAVAAYYVGVLSQRWGKG